MKTLVVGNWKMNLNISEASMLVHRLQERIANKADVEVVLSPSHVGLHPLSRQIDRRKFRLAAQNASRYQEGAKTGEISMSMIHGLVHYVILGHSERRLYFNESNEDIGSKVNAALQHEIVPIVCIGETDVEKRDGMTFRTLHAQLEGALKMVDGTQLDSIVLAYEPRWAIGSGVTPSPSDISEVGEYIFSYLSETYGPIRAKRVRILYGGSVKGHNTKAILQADHINGVLVGGAALNYAEFAKIAEQAHNTYKA